MMMDAIVPMPQWHHHRTLHVRIYSRMVPVRVFGQVMKATIPFFTILASATANPVINSRDICMANDKSTHAPLA